jgi:hypothetical protein
MASALGAMAAVPGSMPPAPKPRSGALLTVVSQTSRHLGLAEEGSLRRMVIEREEPVGHTGGS